MRIAKAQAVWENILQSNKEYVRWISLLHGNRRKEHLALHGMILRRDDPFGSTTAHLVVMGANAPFKV